MRPRPPARSRGPRFLFSRAVRPFLGLALCHCSLSLEDPAREARDKLAKVIPTSMDLMVGRWVGDSTYTSDDIKATRLGPDPVLLEFMPDTSFAQVDTARTAFPAQRSEGVFYLHVDTLILFPLSAAPDTFLVRLRFLGNYLELFRVSEQRYAFFHKLKPRAEHEQDSLLADSLWTLRGRRHAPGLYRSEPQVRDFAYLRFPGDSMFADTRRNGIITLDSGTLTRDERHWTWKTPGGTREFLAEMRAPDSLRLWPLTGGRADSGFYDYHRTSRREPWDIDMRRLIGHLRGDSLRDDVRALEYHYGRYFDWILGADHSAKSETNIAGSPKWSSWTLDSGYLALSETGRPPQRMRVDTAGGRVHLRSDSGAYFPARTVYAATLVSGDFAKDPLARFEKASYLVLKAGRDSMAYFFDESNDKDRFEIYSGAASASLWAGFVLPKSLETFQSGQAGFYLAFEDSTPSLGRFTCRSRPYLDLVIRQSAADPLFASGFIQGTCELQKADSAFSDSALAIEGSFKLRRGDRGGFRNPGWSLP